jgi:hypothetical protein
VLVERSRSVVQQQLTEAKQAPLLAAVPARLEPDPPRQDGLPSSAAAIQFEMRSGRGDQPVMGWLRGCTGSYAGGLYALAGFALLAAAHSAVISGGLFWNRSGTSPLVIATTIFCHPGA